jgi:hypothetical protein
MNIITKFGRSAAEALQAIEKSAHASARRNFMGEKPIVDDLPQM